jgi:hypothetical protein
MGRHWYSVTYFTHKDTRVGPYLVNSTDPLRIGNDIYWGWGPAHFTVTEDMEMQIVKDYGVETEGRDIWEEFTRDNPPPTTQEDDPTEGWLSPEGDLYAFGYGEHSPVSLQIAVLRDYEREDEWATEGVLYDNGWIALRYNNKMLLMGRGMKPTEAQMERLQRITEKHPDDQDWFRGFRYLNLEI